MLSAILHGKARCLATPVELGQPWRHVFRGSEDFLTAAVFERLAYMDDAVLWRLLQRAVRPDLLPPRTIATLECFDFWPRWPLSFGNVTCSPGTGS